MAEAAVADPPVAAWALAVAGPLVLTLAALPLRSSLVLGGFFFRMMLVVIAAAALGGARPALATVVLGVLARELFFAPPFESPRADLRPNVISLIGFAVAGAVVAILIGELAQLAEEQASSRRVEAPLWRVATLVTDGAPADELFAAVAQEAEELLQADQALMNRYESDGTVICVAGWSRTGDGIPLGTRLHLGGKNLTAMVAETGRPARMDSYADATGAVAEVVSEFRFRSAAGAPIMVQGRLWGALLAGSASEQPLATDTEARLGSITELVATAISNAANVTELRASRARIVATADETRRRMERDLHDGAQQRLVSLTLQLRAAQATIPTARHEAHAELDRVARTGGHAGRAARVCARNPSGDPGRRWSHSRPQGARPSLDRPGER